MEFTTHFRYTPAILRVFGSNGSINATNTMEIRPRKDLLRV